MRYLQSIIIGILLISMLVPHNASQADMPDTISLYGYTGYLAIPSAHVTDGVAGLHFGYFPRAIAPMHRGKSDNSVYTSTLCFLPHMELYVSVLVASSTRWMYNYGSEKVRSPGAKLRIMEEKKWLPALAIGMFDPNMRKLGIKSSYTNVSSSFIVMSKRTAVFHGGTVSLGYGGKLFNEKQTRLDGLFGGFTVPLTRILRVSVDYDARWWSEGIHLRWHGFDVTCAYVDGRAWAFRTGYVLNLHEVYKR